MNAPEPRTLCEPLLPLMQCAARSSNIVRQPDLALDPSSKLISAGSGTFNAWLRHRLETSRLTQRQLADKAGIHHSTISRLVRGHRMPSLRTVTSLAHALGVPDVAAMPGELRPDGSRSRQADVEYALRSDEGLAEVDVREIMGLYLAARRAGTRHGPSAPKPSARRMPVPIVVQVLERGR